ERCRQRGRRVRRQPIELSRRDELRPTDAHALSPTQPCTAELERRGRACVRQAGDLGGRLYVRPRSRLAALRMRARSQGERQYRSKRQEMTQPAARPTGTRSNGSLLREPTHADIRVRRWSEICLDIEEKTRQGRTHRQFFGRDNAATSQVSVTSRLRARGGTS